MASTMVALQTVTVGAGGSATVTFSSIPQTYTDLVIQASARGTVTGAGYDLTVGFNGVTTNRTGRQLYGTGGSTGSSTETIYAGVYNGSTATASTFGPINIYIPNYASSNYKSFSVESAAENNAVNGYQYLTAGLWSSTDAITSIELNSTSGNFVQYSTFTLYGVYNSASEASPDVPTIGTATDAGTGTQANVAFTPGTNTGAVYTAVSSPGSITASNNYSPILVSGLTSGTAYTFTVKAANPGGVSGFSAASNSVTPAIPAAWDSISTVTVGAGGVASISFTSIPSTYTHLQIRAVARSTRAVAFDNLLFQANGDTASNYADHFLYADGSTTLSGGSSATSSSRVGTLSGASLNASVFGINVIDILDYANTNKYKTVRSITSAMSNASSGQSVFRSALWLNTAGITSILLKPGLNNFAQYSTFALYGIKG